MVCPILAEKRGLVSKETVVLRRCGSDTRKFGLSTELINQILAEKSRVRTYSLYEHAPSFNGAHHPITHTLLGQHVV